MASRSSYTRSTQSHLTHHRTCDRTRALVLVICHPMNMTVIDYSQVRTCDWLDAYDASYLIEYNDTFLPTRTHLSIVCQLRVALAAKVRSRFRSVSYLCDLDIRGRPEAEPIAVNWSALSGCVSGMSGCHTHHRHTHQLLLSACHTGVMYVGYVTLVWCRICHCCVIVVTCLRCCKL